MIDAFAFVLVASVYQMKQQSFLEVKGYQRAYEASEMLPLAVLISVYRWCLGLSSMSQAGVVRTKNNLDLSIKILKQKI